MSSFKMPSHGPLPAASAEANPLRRLMWFASICTLLAAFAVLACASASADAGAAKKKKKKKDAKPPIAVVMTTADADGDGRLDTIKITYNERVRFAKLKRKTKRARGKTAFRVGGHTVSSVVASGNRVTLKVSESATADTAERPIVSYVRVKKGKKGVADRAGNQAYQATVRARDGIAPMLLSARTTDADSDGRLDGVDLGYSEVLGKADAPAFIVTGRTVTSATPGGNHVQVGLEEGGLDSDAKPPVIAGARAATDASGNAQSGTQSVNAVDGTPPAIVQATTADVDSDGKLDRVALTFSEAVSHPAETTGASLRVNGFTTTAVSQASGTTVNIDFAEGGSNNTGAKPSVDSLTTGQRVTDLNGNQLAAGTFADTTDGAPPVLVSARLRDTSVNGRVDIIAAAFSETVTFTSSAGAFTTTAQTSVLGTLTDVGVSIGAVVNLTVNEVGACCNTNLPTGPDPVPVTYTPPALGGVLDLAGLAGTAGTVNATDGAGPVINYAETADEDGDGFLDHVYVGFSEPVAHFSSVNGSPLLVASGQRELDATPGNEPVLMASGPHTGQIKLTLVELGLDDTDDRPTITYQPPSGSYVRDALLNDSPAGALPFTATTDKAAPVMRSARATDANPVDGHIDTVTSVWSENVATSAAPAFSVIAQNPPSGYTPPSVSSGASALGQVVMSPLNPSSDPDRDVFFAVNYGLGGGVTDTATSPNAARAPASFISPNADCADTEEAFGTHDDDVANANSSWLALNNARHLATLCGDDTDEYSFSVAGSTVVRVLFSPTAAALLLAGRNASYDPFTVAGPGSPSHTTSFIDDVGWQVEFTADPGGGSYAVGVSDSNTPLADYGYCVARSEGAESNPSCNVRQGDLAITEVLRDPVSSVTTMSRYVEVKNLTPLPVPSTELENLLLDIGGASCALEQRNNTPAEIPSGGYFLISDTDIASTNVDFACSGMPQFDYAQPVSLRTTDGVVDNINLGSVSIPAHSSAQVRSGTAFETSTGNDDIAAGWCVSIDYHGSPGVANSKCDLFRLEEAMFMPTSSSRDGHLMIELRGNAPINASSTLLGGWQLRIRPQTGAQKTFTLSAQANPDTNGFYVLADSPNAGGDTYVPFYSEQVPDLDTYLRADVPTTITLLRPAESCAGDTPADTVGYVPGTTGNLTGADDEGSCPAYLVQPYKAKLGFQSQDTLQRKPYAAYGDNNNDDWCAYDPWTPMQLNAECVVQQ